MSKIETPRDGLTAYRARLYLDAGDGPTGYDEAGCWTTEDEAAEAIRERLAERGDSNWFGYVERGEWHREDGDPWYAPPEWEGDPDWTPEERDERIQRGLREAVTRAYEGDWTTDQIEGEVERLTFELTPDGVES